MPVSGKCCKGSPSSLTMCSNSGKIGKLVEQANDKIWLYSFTDLITLHYFS